jgi:7,8-dihydropterin-6-yl-methyl-4-(beta-D-ribofuranosyl)aminobenzene 5'-phosphate synthase
MNIVALAENTSPCPELICEHGLSLYIEACGLKILFDAGQSDAFARNALRLGVDLAHADLAVLSHGHYDHGGGLSEFLRINPSAPVYARQEAFMPHFNTAGTSIGLDSGLPDSGRIIFTGDQTQLAPGVTLVSGLSVPAVYPVDHGGMRFMSDEGPVPEDFRHEQYLIIYEAGKTICISGCSHRGIVNIVRHFRPDVLVGGFHLMKTAADDPRLESVARQLRDFPTLYYTGHCTGLPQYFVLKKIMGDRLKEITTGSYITIQ